MSDPTDTAARPDNRLGAAASLYLRQHAGQPVPWREWGPGVLVEAAARDVPIFLSSGYSSCHWCHVMAHESFDDPDVGRVLGELFVCVKVDREERPDVDAAALDAVQAMTGQGGWPLTAFLLPDGRPFWGGTYFPRHARRGMPGVLDVARSVGREWVEQRAVLEQSAADVAALVFGGGTIASSYEPAGAGGNVRAQVTAEPDHGVVERAAFAALERADLVRGGFERAPKFPPPLTLELVLRALAGERGDLVPAAVLRTLDAMLHGGMYDQLGGGFHRYSVDPVWRVPHFEKMLYDNAQLLRAYAMAHRVTGAPQYARAVRETLAFLLRDMRSGGGDAFGSALDADTDGVEGTTYTWTSAELVDVLGAGDGERVAALLQVDDAAPSFEGRDTLALAEEPDPATWAWWAPLRDRLLAARAGRAQPAFDPKVIAAWNGLLLGALADAWIALGDGDTTDDLLVTALALAEHLTGAQVDAGGELRRTWHPSDAATDTRGASDDGGDVSRGALGAPAFAEDLADVAWGLLRLAEATGDARWFEAAEAHARRLLDEFDDAERGGVYSTSAAHVDALGRHKVQGDHPVPSPTSMAATVWAELARWRPDEPRWRERAAAAIASFGPAIERHPTHLAQAAVALDVLARPGAAELVVVAPAGVAPGAELRAAVAPFLPDPHAGLHAGLLVAFGREGDAHPGLADRPARDGRVTAYLCEGATCQAPTADPAELRAQLERLAGAHA